MIKLFNSLIYYFQSWQIIQVHFKMKFGNIGRSNWILSRFFKKDYQVNQSVIWLFSKWINYLSSFDKMKFGNAERCNWKNPVKILSRFFQFLGDYKQSIKFRNDNVSNLSLA